MSARFDSVPVVDVTKENFPDLWLEITTAIKAATFISMDTELSGIGSRKLLMAKSVDDRYIGISENARTRSIVSLGMSCFRLDNVSSSDGIPEGGDVTPGAPVWRYSVQTYNLMALCSEEYVVEPNSLKFLISHGFDFNRQYSSGIPYHRGNDKEDVEDSYTLRQLFSSVVQADKPVVFHNGLMDLIYLYQNLYANLPSQLSTFLADLTEIFGGGIFDTKYIADYVQLIPASYLEYVFRKSQRENCQRSENGKSSISIAFPQCFVSDIVNHCRCPLPADLNMEEDITKETVDLMRKSVCECFAGHGWCEYGTNCRQSHDMDLILDLDHLGQTKEVRKRKRRRQNKSQNGTLECDGNQVKGDTVEDMELQVASSDVTTVQQLPNKYSKKKSDISNAGCHRSGFDSFMTGFSLAVIITQYGSYKGSTEMGELGINQFKNNLSLSGKDMPLTVSKSSFSKTSKEHKDKMKRLSKCPVYQ